MPRFLGRDVWLLEPHASHQVTLLFLSEMEKSISCAGIKGTDALFFGPILGRALLSSGHRLVMPKLILRRRGGGCTLVGPVRSRASCVWYLSKNWLLLSLLAPCVGYY